MHRLKLALFCVLCVFSHLGAAKDVIVQIAYTDGISITEKGTLDLQAIIKEQHPNARIITITQPTPRFFTLGRKNRNRNKMLAKLRDIKINEDEQIRLIVLATHGNTIKKKITSLNLVGEIGEDDLSKSAKEFFAPFVSHMAPDARIVLESCSTMCGSTESAQKRSKQLFDYLQIPNGSLFGATETLRSSYSSNTSWKLIFLMGIGSLLSGEIVTFVDLLTTPEVRNLTMDAFRWKFGMTFLTYSIVFGLFSTVVKFKFYPDFIKFLESQKLKNEGRLISIADQQNQTVTLYYNQDLKQILSCEEKL